MASAVMYWARTRAFIARRADRAGGSNAAWIIVALLAGIELVGVAPVTASWPRQDASIARAVSGASQVLGEHAAGVLGGRSDPFLAWAEVTVPFPSRWLAIAAVPVLITLMLAVVREHQATTLSARALRLAAIGVAYVVVALYLRHLVVSLLNPLAIGLVSIHLVLLLLAIGGIGLLVRSTVGRPSSAQRVSGRTAGDHLRAALVVLVAVVAGMLLVGMIPPPA
jgi:Na+-transporting methylmalonyl-CoA/oxaloacetate decarboxylase gamma subunit